MAFVVLDYHFNLRKIFRDLERNGIQNAICPPGVKVWLEICYSSRKASYYNDTILKYNK